MGNPPSRTDLNNSNQTSSSVTSPASQDDPDPLPIRSVNSDNKHLNIDPLIDSNNNFTTNTIITTDVNPLIINNAKKNNSLHLDNHNHYNPHHHHRQSHSHASSNIQAAQSPRSRYAGIPLDYSVSSSSSSSFEDGSFPNSLCGSYLTSPSVSSFSTNLSSSNYQKTTLYPIDETTNSLSTFMASPSSSSPSSPSSTDSQDLPFKLDIDKEASSTSPNSTSTSTSSSSTSTSNTKAGKLSLSVEKLSKLQIGDVKQNNQPNAVSQLTKTLIDTKTNQPTPKRQINLDLDLIIEKLVASGLAKKNPKYFPLSYDEIRFISSKSRRIFMSQPMLLELAAPVKIVGDIHGQFHDLLRIFKLCGFPPNSNYLFMGDYVDRGKQSLETMVLLLCLKIKYPENFFLLRGNHETAEITKMYGFYDECKRRTSAGVKTWKLFVDVFNTLPVAATIADKIFCVHGGLSPDLHDLNQIRNIQRPTDIPDEGLLADLLWSDPQDLNELKPQDPKSSKSSSKLKSKSKHKFQDWKPNDRGVSYCFNSTIVKNFCKKFDFDLVARGHMVVEDGYEFYASRKLVTIFSAPNYCGEFKNWGAVMNVNKKLMCSFELLKPKEKK